MIITSQKETLREQISQWKMEGQSVAFVPTMGNLHAGHLALVEHAQDLADNVVVSIFVNPTQFNNPEDLSAYPRTLEEDCKALQEHECDLLFVPSTEMMYQNSEVTTTVTVPNISTVLEGDSRPGHFDGVSTIVAKLFNLVTPNHAIFGEKDFQQLLVIKKMVQELDYDINIIAYPTQRDNDGLALSSRNGYLTQQEREIAPKLYQSLNELGGSIKTLSSDHYPDYCTRYAHILNQAGFKTDYIEIRRQEDLLPPTDGDTQLVILAAAWLGKARLIDNLPISLEETDQ